MKKWNVLKSSVVHKNPYFNVVEEEFLLSGGKTGKYYLIKVPDFVAVAAIEEDCIYLVEMERYTLGKRMLEIPMGGVEKGETSLRAARRELREETGIRAKKLKKIGCLEALKGRSSQRFTVFIAEGLSFGEQDLDDVEKDGGVRLVKMKISEIPELIRKGKMTDSHTLAAFQLFMLNYKG